MTSPTESLLPPGTRLAHYEIGRPVGAGAMGTVYEAHDTALDRTVAVKVLKPEISKDEATITRFVREARAAAKVNHPNLTHIYFVGREEERRFFAMEFLPGRTLEEAIFADGPMDLATAVEVLVQAARGLGAAHRAEVVHRDVKPSNLLWSDGVVRITDFGLAKSVSGEIDLTGDGSILGTPRYMSPEQCRGEPLDRQTDIYSLGLLGFFLLTGDHAYQAPTIGKLLDDQMNAPLPPISAKRPDLPPDVEKVFGKLCAKRRADRPETMEDAVHLLETIRPRQLDLAPLAARGGALLLDLLVVAMILLGLDGLSVLAIGVPLENHAPRLHHLIGFALVFLSQVGLEVWLGTSIGKRAFHLRIVKTNGSPLGAGTATGRYFLRLPFTLQDILARNWYNASLGILQVAILLVSAFTYLFRGRRTLSDLLTRTRVVHGLATEKTK